MNPVVKVSATLNRGGDAPAGDRAYTKLSEVPEEKLATMRKDDRETYIKLFKAEYGFAPEFED